MCFKQDDEYQSMLESVRCHSTSGTIIIINFNNDTRKTLIKICTTSHIKDYNSLSLIRLNDLTLYLKAHLYSVRQ